MLLVNADGSLEYGDAKNSRVSDRGLPCHEFEPSNIEQRRTLNLSRAETSSRWCGVEVRRGGANSGVVYVTRPWLKMTWSVAKSPRVAEQCDVNIPSIWILLERICPFRPQGTQEDFLVENAMSPSQIVLFNFILGYCSTTHRKAAYMSRS
ncbi:uncharacterized protein TNCV_3055141 [Trichonephila clavipes]|nr:uncharacterized protein TNCV_3055141 [Trichonephila clavipes]